MRAIRGTDSAALHMHCSVRLPDPPDRLRGVGVKHVLCGQAFEQQPVNTGA